MKEGETKPRILMVTRNFPPLTGGMERLMQHTAEGISCYADLTIIGPTGCRAYAPPKSTVHEVPFGLLPFLTIGSMIAARACLRKNFDLAIGGSGLAAPTLWILKGLFKLRTAVFIHGLDIVVNNFIYQKAFIPAVRAADLLIANSQSTKALAIERGVAERKITVIHPGTTLPELSSLPPDADFCSRHRIQDKRVVLFTGRITRRKGLSQFITRSLPAIVQAHPDTVLLVVGDSPDQSLNRNGETEHVNKALEDSGLGKNVLFLGKVGDRELTAAYAAADVQVLPLVEVPGDIEGFGMVAIEAAALGTPTVAFSLGGVTDAISPGNGRLVPEGRYDLFSSAVCELFNDSTITAESCRKHASDFSWKIVSARLKEVLAQTMDD